MSRQGSGDRTGGGPLGQRGAYILSACVGQGTYGTVYKARHQDGRLQDFAVKVIPRAKLNSKAAEDNLVHEIGLLSKLKHPNLVQLFDFWCDDCEVTMVMEFCPGGDLWQYIQQKQALHERQAQHFLRQLASALQYMHSQNVAHLDLKPQNLLLFPLEDRLPLLKVADFGFACQLLESDGKQSMRGSPLYMAPEMVAAGSYDARADLWSIGVILFESLFGFAPFTSETYAELWQKISAAEVVIPDHPPLSTDCRRLLRGLLCRDPDERLGFKEFFADPFVDLAHSPAADSCERAKELAVRAVKLDEQGEVGRAYQAYEAALHYFVPAIQYEGDPRKRQALRSRVDQYFERAEQLKAVLAETFPGRAATQAPERPSAPPSPGDGGCDLPLFSLSELPPRVLKDLQAALEEAKQARASDTPTDYPTSRVHYEQAIEMFMKTIKPGMLPPRIEQQLRARVDKLLKRAEQLRHYHESRIQSSASPWEPPRTQKGCCVQ
eukprot:m.154737 g.154737  ORF g.154737 m.154737 type:complete len:494 (+) comp17508_c0_seq3:301-1782(+)